MNRKRIAVLTPVGGVGGVQKVITNLVNGLTTKGWLIDVICADGKDGLPGLDPDVSLVDLGVAKSHGDLKLILGYRSISRQIRSAGYSAIITAPGFAGQIGILATRGTTTKIVVMADNKISLLKELDAMHRVQFELARVLYPKADAVVAAHDSAMKDLQGVLPEGNAQLERIYHPLIPDNVESLMRAEPEITLPEGLPIIVAAGRLVEEKDFDTLLKSFSIVHSKIACRLVILGDGPLRESLVNHTARLGVGDDVVFAGRVNNVYSIFARSSVFVLSSKREAFGNVLIEALSCGLPCVATRCDSGGPQEILDNGKYGLLVSIGDTEGLADSLLKLIAQSDIDYASLSARGKVFSCDSSVNNYSALLERLTLGTSK